MSVLPPQIYKQPLDVSDSAAAAAAAVNVWDFILAWDLARSLISPREREAYQMSLV